jgi:hypothetical protein
VTKSDGRALVQIKPRTLAVVQTFNVGNAPGAAAVGKDAVWVANTVDGTISRVDLASGSVGDAIVVGPNPAGIAVGPNAIWIAVESTQRSLKDLRSLGHQRRRGHRQPDRSALCRSESNGHPRQPPSGIALAGRLVYATTVVPSAGHRGGVLGVMSEPSECRCVDPIFALGTNVADFGVADLVYDGLVAFRRVGGSAGAELVPNLAARLPTSTDDGRTFRVQLRSGIHYSDGTPVRTADFRAAVERDLALNPGTVFRGIIGAARCLARPGKRCDLSRGIEVDNATRTIVIRLTRADVNFAFKLALPEAALVPVAKAPRTARAHSMPGTGRTASPLFTLTARFGS